MFKKIAVKRVSVGTLIKLIVVGFVSVLLPFGFLMGLFALFGASTVTWNQQPLTGLIGLIASPFIALFIAGLFSLITAPCLIVGLWLYSLVRPISLVVKQPVASE